ncbi:MAG: 2-amino-4-hydroxy-6-hydroxymethyldihydropteridine diphosphokinase [Pseudobdellovibrionaceae bacterium]
MILIGLGANLPSSYGTPAQTLDAAKKALRAKGIKITASSSTWLSAPVDCKDGDPWYANAVIAVSTELYAIPLLALLHDIEAEFGRVRTYKNAPRVLDLDLITYKDQVFRNDYLTLPHPRMHERAFVLRPMLEILDESWRHPYMGRTLSRMISELDDTQQTKRLEEGEEYRLAG